MNRKFLIVFAIVVAGCDSHTPGSGRTIESLTGPAIHRDHDPQQVAQGASLYGQHCARCHGQKGEGATEWRHRDTDGMFPPPPLDGAGHAWHHSTPVLKQMILDGSPAGQGKMPAWRGKLSEKEVEAIITWFQSQWPDQVYAAWYEMQQGNK
jgi:mono/diheme cytochrome c family protein